MTKQAEFFAGLLSIGVTEKIGRHYGDFYAIVNPCKFNQDGVYYVRLRVVFYDEVENVTKVLFDIPVTGLGFKWLRDWALANFPLMGKKLQRLFDSCFEIIGRQVVLRLSFYEKYKSYYGSKYKGYKL